jgi:hypothetical protein
MSRPVITSEIGFVWVRFLVKPSFLGEKWENLGSFRIKRLICRTFSTGVEFHFRVFVLTEFTQKTGSIVNIAEPPLNEPVFWTNSMFSSKVVFIDIFFLLLDVFLSCFSIKPNKNSKFEYRNPPQDTLRWKQY